MSTGRVLRIAVPGLADSVSRLARDGVAASLPAVEWLAARGRVGAAEARGWRAWLLDGAGLGPDVLQRFPAGPCSVAGREQGQRPGGAWARAEPVHLLTAIDHLQLAPPVPIPLEPDETIGLLDTLNAHLAGTGFELRAHADGGWICECPAGLDCDTVDPAEALGRNLRELLPSGRDASRVRALVNELQMMLHEHPVNQRRVARALAPVNSVWMWGIGTATGRTAAVVGELLSDDAWLGGLWRLHGGRVGRPGDLAAVLGGREADVRVSHGTSIEGADGTAALRELDAGLFAPARSALLASRVDRVLVHCGCWQLDVTPAARWKFWRRGRPLRGVLA